MAAWDEIDTTAQAFTRAALHRAAAQQERLFYDSTDPSAKIDAGRRCIALLAAADYLTTDPAPTPAVRDTAPNGGIASDSAAVDRSAHWPRDPEWGVGMLEDIAEVISATGRDLTGNSHPTWGRH